MTDQSFPSVAGRYKECFLQLRQGFFGTEITRGEYRESVGPLGLFTLPAIDEFMNEVPVAGDEWKLFRREHVRASVLVVAGGIAAVAGTGISVAQGGQIVATTIAAAGFVALAIALWKHEGAMKSLRRALFSYNSTLERP